MAEDSKPEAFEITKYNHDRHHEVELNRFTHTLEVEQLKLLILLNGGAATALLTFAEQATVRGNGFFPVAIACWLVGLIVGASATIITRKVQSDYGKAYRFRRRAIEWRRIKIELADTNPPGDGPPDDAVTVQDLQRLLGLPEGKLLKRLQDKEHCTIPPIDRAGGAILYDEAAGLIVDRARKANDWIFPLSVASLMFFLAGAVAATAMIVRTPVLPAQPQAVANAAAPR